MRLFLLYLRSRHVPATLAAAAGAVAALWAVAQAAGSAGTDVCGVLAVTAGCAVAGAGLAGADVELERCAAVAWSPRRFAHVVAVATTVAALVLGTALTGDELAPLARVVRDVAGTAGLTALGAATVGASRAWTLPLGSTLLAWMLVALSWPVPARETHQAVLAWMFQPTTSDTATATAAILGTAGTLAYALRGASSATGM